MGVVTSEQFLQPPYIEDSPAWEFIQGEAIQKPMPGGKHSRLQYGNQLCTRVDD